MSAEASWAGLDLNNYVNFWEETLTPYLSYEMEMADQTGTFTSHLNFDKWWTEYGAFMPGDDWEGRASLFRAHELGDISKENLANEFAGQRYMQAQETGASGFSGSGRSIGAMGDLWESYVNQATHQSIQTQETIGNIYESQGEQIYTALQDLGQEGAFDVPDECFQFTCISYQEPGQIIIDGQDGQCYDLQGFVVGPAISPCQ